MDSPSGRLSPTDAVLGSGSPMELHEPLPDDNGVMSVDEAAASVDIEVPTITDDQMAIAPIADHDTIAPQDNAILIDGNQNGVKDVPTFENLYCLLELITEQGSGGIVDKIIISQDSLSKFINTLSPNAYTSLTKVDFKALDAHLVQPIGVYGSRESIVSLFLEFGILDDIQAQKMLPEDDDIASQEALQPGLYIALPPETVGSELYIVYWPEKGTWKDDAPSSIRRNRITFMRYLTKIAHQIICLFSDEESASFVWNNNDDEPMDDTEDNEEEQIDRLFTFEVAKTLEQEENVTTRLGFNITLSHELVPASRKPQQSSSAPSDLILLAGETTQGFLTSRFVEPRSVDSWIRNQRFNAIQLKSLLAAGKIYLTPRITLEAINILIEDGLSSRFLDLCRQTSERKREIEKDLKALETSECIQSQKELSNGFAALEETLLLEILKRLKTFYPHIEFESLTSNFTALQGDEHLDDPFLRLVQLYPALRKEFDQIFEKSQWNKIRQQEYQHAKKKFIMVETCLEATEDITPEKQSELVAMIFSDADLSQAIVNDSASKGIFTRIVSFFGGSVDAKNYQTQAGNRAKGLPDTTFLGYLVGEPSRYGGPLVADHISKILQLATTFIEDMIRKCLVQILERAKDVQQKLCKSQLDRIVESKRTSLCEEWRSAFIHDLQALQEEQAVGGQIEQRTLELTEVSAVPKYWSSSVANQTTSYNVSAKETTQSDPVLEYMIHILELTAEHRGNLELDQTFVPKPLINNRFSSSFQLPIGHCILHAQLLAKDTKLLLIVDDQRGTISIFLDSLSSIGNAVKNNRSRKVIKQEKTGKEVVVAFDESKRMIALHACAKALLYIFVFDENFGSLQSWAHPVDLSRWYATDSTIIQTCFVTGNEELLLVDNQGQGRIFSLITQQCRPASVAFQQLPVAIYPSPDGACFLALFDTGRKSIRAYHWTTFGSNDGILVDVDLRSGDQLSLTSFVKRTNVHLIHFDPDTWQCRSVVLDITKKATEFMFQEKSSSRQDNKSDILTTSNCLLDCHYDVWTRFPVLAAVERHTKTTGTQYSAKRLLCIANRNDLPSSSYFGTMIRTFEQKTRKPTGKELRSILVESLTFKMFSTEFTKTICQNVSQFRGGEWLVDILCLIPIHLAITRENRFIPLKDGVTSAEYEKSLLGADVSTVVDSISFGWYESILQSYMSTKPVKVVSSMGEQSVGKSYSLNHLVDTSFAGSAMRTTEGVWMSVTPTNDALLVALDFEGVHSIERSAQEDTLLVLFNTAISNLVLFRNNFALSRDITGLFQSFQSSSAVFDPAANPTLFRSTLVIIIKDVVDSDKKEIVREFSLKFQKIVQEEQESNFISRLHAGQLNIVPWPVIESKQFYTLFPAIKAQLDKQPITHATAGNFLRTMKTLMAKLKANDWRALSQSMASHRAHRLLSILPNALTFGYSEVEPHPEPLKDLDTEAVIDYSDSPSQLFLSDMDVPKGERDVYLMKLCQSWEGYSIRLEKDEAEWVQDLSTYLTHVVDTRVAHVQAWITKNLEGFHDQKTPHASITALHRMFDATVINIKANVELCKQPCSSCQLRCLLNRRHDGEAHNCATSHKCRHQCGFSEGHPDKRKACGYPAGHGGKHVCVVEEHLCGEPCVLKDKVGCLGECTQVVGHKDEDHRCSSRVHSCGKPCILSTVHAPSVHPKRVRASICSGTCAIPSDIDHDDHVCDNRMCPVKCILCNRLCSSTDHLHSLDAGAVHLCGEIHSCQKLCSAEGICEIDTAPQSIEATFTGRHETFQYTKYSQIAKRLQCVVPIPAMQRAHIGEHTHTADPKPFHFCETRCIYCGYYCTLPRGHSQQEHETSHGSMSKTRWAIEDPDAVLELNGRKFGSDDDGAPMMCNLVCQDMGRHLHINNCRAASEGVCNGPDVQHIQARINPNPDKPKDWITHELYWKRSGFKDPYSRDDRTNFAKCDAMCPGAEHAGTATNPTQPSYCTLPLFHAHHRGQATGLGYTSHDGHHFSCKNPAVMQQAFHVIFVIDRSGSMSLHDRRPLPGTPVTSNIAARHNDRLGAVYSSLYSFWMSRLSAVAVAQAPQATASRRDAYSVILFDHRTVKCVNNDFTSTPDQLLNQVMPYSADGGTNYAVAVSCAGEVMRLHWSTERAPVVIFLSDGECGINDQDMQTLCRSSIALGKPLSFHGVSFGTSNNTLRRMVQIARDIQTSVPIDPLLPQTATVESSFSEALDTVRLAETFLGIADSLKKPRGALFT